MKGHNFVLGYGGNRYVETCTRCNLNRDWFIKEWCRKKGVSHPAMGYFFPHSSAFPDAPSWATDEVGECPGVRMDASFEGWPCRGERGPTPLDPV